MSKTVLIVIDGLRPDAIPATATPNIDALIASGASSLQATTVMPSITLSAHMSMFHSVPPTRHGVTTNTFTPMARPLPGLVDVAKLHGRSCAFVDNWEQLRDCARPGSLDIHYYIRNGYDHKHGDRHLADVAVQILQTQQPDFLFLYFGCLDAAGHDYGWLSETYLQTLTYADEAVGITLNALDASDFVLLQSDHGGHERSHGTDSTEDMLIPWIVRGPGIKQGFEISTPVSLLDSAPTMARFLGVPAHPEWEGRTITEIFS